MQTEISNEPVILSREVSQKLRTYAALVHIEPRQIAEFMLDSELNQCLNSEDTLGAETVRQIAEKTAVQYPDTLKRWRQFGQIMN